MTVTCTIRWYRCTTFLLHMQIIFSTSIWLTNRCCSGYLFKFACNCRCGLGPNVMARPPEEVYNGVSQPATIAAIIEARTRVILSESAEAVQRVDCCSMLGHRSIRRRENAAKHHDNCRLPHRLLQSFVFFLLSSEKCAA